MKMEDDCQEPQQQGKEHERLCWLYQLLLLLLLHRFTAFWRQQAYAVKLGKLGLAH
jgi:hypothetical protein